MSHIEFNQRAFEAHAASNRRELSAAEASNRREHTAATVAGARAAVAASPYDLAMFSASVFAGSIVAFAIFWSVV